MAFTRGIPWLAQLLLRWIPEDKAVPEYKRQAAAIGLTVQMFAGAGLGIAAQAVLAWGLIFHVMPWIGLDLLDMARAVADFDLPARIGQLFARFLALK
jgi:K+-transporting ATPase A subunit